LDPGGHELSQTANKHYAKAAQTYFNILKRIKEDEKFAPPGATAIIQVRLAVCLRAINRHQEAMKLLVNILQQRENRVDVQIEAARTYQDWAEMPDKSGYYEFAIKGGQKQDGRYLVWGWGGIAKRVGPFMKRGGGKYEEIFYDARYNLALSRLKLAEAKQGAEKAKTLEMAEKDITRVHQLYPKMGGQQWYRKFDALLKNIQKLRGVRRPAGLGG